jgi:hypothetical protein
VNQASSRQPRTNRSIQSNPPADNSGFVIDDNGREIAITEQMIQQACAEFERHWRPAGQRPQAVR